MLPKSHAVNVEAAKSPRPFLQGVTGLTPGGPLSRPEPFLDVHQNPDFLELKNSARVAEKKKENI